MSKKLIEKLAVDAENHEYLMKNYQEGSRFKLFSNVFFGKMGAMSRTNWLMLLFSLPAIAAIIYTAVLSYRYAEFTPFTANLGIGYPVVSDAAETYWNLMFRSNMFRSLLLIPCIIIGFIGLAGAFNVIKYESLGFSVKILKTFFKGIKNNFVTYMWLGLVNGITFFLFMMSINFFGIHDLGLAWKIVSIALSVLLMALVLILSFYIMTQAALYDLSLGKMIKNAFHLTFSFIIQNVIMLVFSMIPVGLMLLINTSTFLMIIVIMICAMMGFSFIVCVWTIYNHYVYGMLFTASIEQDKGKKGKRARQNK